MNSKLNHFKRAYTTKVLFTLKMVLLYFRGKVVSATVLVLFLIMGDSWKHFMIFGILIMCHFFCIFLRYANKEARCLNGRNDCFICEASSCIGAWQNRFRWEQKEDLCKRWSNKGERYFHTLSSRSKVEWICIISNVKKNWDFFFISLILLSRIFLL